jgi:2-amino-4-hydroxy-6-hydroxymethyldihydropteridine diphosphokinase
MDEGHAAGVSKAARCAFLSLGSNLGDRRLHLRRAREALAALPGTAVLAASRIYETAPQDLADQPPFLNQVVCLQTGLPPAELLAAAQAIEAVEGRVRGVRFGPRTLDVDILLIEDHQSDDPALTVPHPRMWQRAFVLVPLAEVWSLARGMPVADVAALARDISVRQPVTVFGESEAQQP